MRLLRLGLVLMVLGVLLAACGGAPTAERHDEQVLPNLSAVTLAEGEKLRVVATTSIVGDVVAQVGGEAIELMVLLPAGQDPHAYQPSAQDLGRASQAHIIFVNGFELEEGLLKDLEYAAEGVPMVPVSVGIEPLEGKADEHHDEDGHEGESDTHDHAQDPHVWFNVSYVERWVDNIEHALSTLEPAKAQTYGSHAEAYSAELAALDEEVRETVNSIPEANRKLVTNHDSFSYFAEAYGFEVIGTVIPTMSTNAEASASDLSHLIETINQEQVHAIFIDSSASDKLAKIVADETGAKVFELYTETLGEKGSGAESYIGMMRTNVERIAEGLRK